MTDQTKDQADRIAAAGFRAVIPDLYRGALGVDAEEASHLMDNLDFPGAVQDIAGAAAYLRATGANKVGVMGFCMGGALTLASTISIDDVDAGVVFYGICPDGLADPKTLSKPLQCHFGNNDTLEGFSDPAAADELENKLSSSPGAAGVEFFRYDGVGHAFLNDLPEFIERKKAMGFGDHDEAAAALAWTRSVSFLAQHLQA